MKKLLTSVFLLLSIFSHAQWQVTATNVSTGEIRAITLPSSGGGGVNSVNGRTGAVVLTQNDVGLNAVNNTSDLNKPISVATQNALNLKQNKLIPGSGITIDANNVISATGGGGGGGISLPYTYFQPEQTWAFTLQPPSYGTSYPNGTRQGRWFALGYKTNPVVGGIRPDPVFTTSAYNILLPNGSREFSNEAAWEFGTIEGDFPNPGFVPPGDFEGHIFRTYSTDGGEHRHHSVYVNKVTGKARQDFEADGFEFMKTRGGAGSKPITFAAISPSTLTLYQETGKGMGLQMYNPDGTLGGQFYNAGGIFKFSFNQVSWDGFNNLIAPLPVYLDNNAAKNAGAKINQWYKDNNGMVRIVQ